MFVVRFDEESEEEDGDGLEIVLFLVCKRSVGGKKVVKRKGWVVWKLDEIGDDCMWMSDMEIMDGLDDGVDLEDFVVDDDVDLFGLSVN